MVEERDKTTRRVRGTTGEIALAARRLRQVMTPAEQILWDALKEQRLGGLKFRRQHPVGPFILDFYCPALKLVIELDGAGHADQVDYDEARTEQLRSYGYRVLRFRNEQVFDDLTAVVQCILDAASPSGKASEHPPTETL